MTNNKNIPTVSWLFTTFKTKSARIRYLADLGMNTGDISKYLNMSYQHVRNVLKHKLKRGPHEKLPRL